MCDLVVCRVCFRTDNSAKYYKFDEFYLKCYYEEITAVPFNVNDGLPKYFCYQCSALLNKYHYFMEKCCFAQRTLKNMAWTAPLTYNRVCNMYSKRNHIVKRGEIEIIKISRRVKTYTFLDDGVATKFNTTTRSKQSDKESSDSDKDSFIDDKNDSGESEEEIPVSEICVELKKKCNDDYDIFEGIDHIKPEEKVVQEPKETKDESQKQKRVSKKVNEEPQKTNDEPEKPNDEPEKLKGSTEKAKDEPEEAKDGFSILKNLLSKSKCTKSNAIAKNNKKTVKNNLDTNNYRFTKLKDGKLKVLQFLDSGFWRKLILNEEEALREFEAKAKNEKYLRAAYRCTDCNKPFSQKNMLDRHKLRQHSEAVGSFVCRFCKMRFRQAGVLGKHMKQHLTKYECLRCNLVCNAETTALFHEEYHSGVIRKCPHCDKEFKHLSTFYTHLRTHRSKHMCTLCGESFVSPLGLRLHTKRKHIMETENNLVTDAESNTYCEVCKITFETKDAYTKHLLHSAMHADDFPSGDKTSSTNQSEELFEDGEAMDDKHSDKSEPTTGITNIYTPRHRTNTNIHHRTNRKTPKQLFERKSKVERTLSAIRKSNLPAVTGAGWKKKPTTCQHCGKHFASQSLCRKHHLAEHHRAPFHTEKVICEICGALIAPGSVSAHLNQHTRRKTYTCETCGKSFTASNVLRDHMATHTGERNYKCSICEKSFRHNGSLHLHYRTVHLKQPYIRDRKKKIDVSNIGEFFGKPEFM